MKFAIRSFSLWICAPQARPASVGYLSSPEVWNDLYQLGAILRYSFTVRKWDHVPDQLRYRIERDLTVIRETPDKDPDSFELHVEGELADEAGLANPYTAADERQAGSAILPKELVFPFVELL